MPFIFVICEPVSPARVQTIKRAYTVREHAAERARECRATEEECDAPVPLVSLVVHREHAVQMSALSDERCGETHKTQPGNNPASLTPKTTEDVRMDE
jgi:hypothetical protein